MRPRAALLAALVAGLAAAPVPADELPDLDLLPPLSVEAGPVIAPALGVAPATFAWAGVAADGGTWDVGRAAYTEVSGRLTAGGTWSPSCFPRLALGGDFVLLEERSLHTVVPPALDAWTHRVDLGELRVHVSALAWAWDDPDGSMQAGVRPYVRLTLPTDTAHDTPGRRAPPLRRVLGDGVASHPFVLTDVGAAAAWRWKLLELYLTLGFVFGAVIDSDLQFLLASTTGVALDFGEVGLALLVELNYLGRLTDAPGGGGTLDALALSPGLRWRTGDLTLGLETRVGLTGDALAPYGAATGGVTVRYDF